MCLDTAQIVCIEQGFPTRGPRAKD